VTALYAIVLGFGFVSMLVWVARAAIADTVDGWEAVDPEVRFGARGRYVVAGALGFGLAGMSATFAGWPALGAVAAALGGCGFLILVATRYAPAADDGANEESVT